MKIVVCVKHAVDEFELKADETGKPRFQGTQMKMSTFDRNAVEEGVRTKEARGGSTAVITLGDSDAKKTIKEALAMGIDRGYLLTANPDDQDTLTTSYLLAKAIEKLGGFDLVLCSEGASDTYQGQVGAMIAEWLNLPYLGYARKVEVKNESVQCEEALEDRVEVTQAKLPAVISIVSEINEARYPTLLQIMQASKKPLEELRPDSLGDPPSKLVSVIDLRAQSMVRKRVLFEGGPDESAGKLIEALKKEGALKN